MSPARATLLHSPGRHSCIAQGASPGLGIDIHFLSPVGAAQPQSRSPNTRAVSAAPKGAHFTFICKYPGFHIGLCPHSTLGYAGVSCLKALVISLNVDNNAARAAQCNSLDLIWPWTHLPTGLVYWTLSAHLPQLLTKQML